MLRYGTVLVKNTLIALALVLLCPAVHAADLANGKALSSQCSVCHGKNGIAKDPEAGNLAGQSAFYLEKAMVDFQKGLRQDRRMSIIAQSLSLQDIKDLAAWYAAFELTVTEPKLE